MAAILSCPTPTLHGLGALEIYFPHHTVLRLTMSGISFFWEVDGGRGCLPAERLGFFHGRKLGIGFSPFSACTVTIHGPWNTLEFRTSLKD